MWAEAAECARTQRTKIVRSVQVGSMLAGKRAQTVVTKPCMKGTVIISIFKMRKLCSQPVFEPPWSDLSDYSFHFYATVPKGREGPDYKRSLMTN